MGSQARVTSLGAQRLGWLTLAVVVTLAVAGSGIVYRSAFAPALAGGMLVAALLLVGWVRRPVWALYAALLVVMLPTGLIPAATHSNLNRGLTVLAFGIWLFSVLAQRRRITWTVTASCMSGFLIWGLLTLAWADHLSVGFDAVQMYALRLALYLVLVANLIQTEDALDGLMGMLALLGWLLVLAGLWTLVRDGYTPGTRFRILEMNENGTGILLLVTLPGVLWQAIRSSGWQRPIKQGIGYGFVAVALALVALSGSRGSAIAFVITLAALGLWKATRPWAKFSFVLLIVALICLPVVFSTLTVRFAIEEGDTVLGGREAIWLATSQLIREHPWGGVGIGGAESAVAPYVMLMREVYDYDFVAIHNPVLAIWAATGMPGLLLYLSVLLSAIWLFVRQHRESRRGRATTLGPYFALISALLLGYMAVWIKGGGMEYDFTFFLLLALLVIPSRMQLAEPIDNASIGRASAVQ